MATEESTVRHLYGTKENPAHDPQAKDLTSRGTVGDTAFMDAVMIVVIAWVLLLVLWFSLRHHNI